MTPSGVRLVTERAVPGDLPIWTHPEWEERFPWLAQGVTSGGTGPEPFDLGLFGATPVGAALGRWRLLREGLGFAAVAHSRQVHQNRILIHRQRPAAGLLIAEGYDGHLTAAPGLLLTASVADCVPVSVIDAESRAIAVVHAGWRGVVGAIAEGAIGLLFAEHARAPGSLWLHCGPAICGKCYEVGPEVHQAVYADREPPAGPAPIDLRAALAERALSAGVPPAQVSISTHCTRCGSGGFFSHRGGSPSRQMAFIGIRDPG